MPWFKVDDAFHSHPKAMKAGTAALGLWVRCGSWVAQQLTDGYVPVDVVRMYGTSNQAKALVAAGLWDQVDGGYRFHEWHPTNPTRAEVEELRESKRTAGSAGGKASGKSRAKAKQSASTNEAPCLPSGSEVLNTTPLHSTPEGSNEPSRARKRATAAPDIFPVTPEMRNWAVSRGIHADLVRETESFLNHHRAKGTTFKDWGAAWRTWMNNTLRFGGARPQSPNLAAGDEEWMR